TGASSRARGVGTNPRPRRTTRGSPSKARSRASALLTADWVTLSRRAARVALRSSRTASSATKRFRSSADRFIPMMYSISNDELCEFHGASRLEGMTHPRRALIIGGGIAGPATALFLARHGFQPQVFE